MNARVLAAVICLLLAWPLVVGAAGDENKDTIKESLERRQKVELRSFFLQDPENAEMPGSYLGVGLYNQAVAYFQEHEYDLAEQTALASLKQDDLNPLAYELLGDIYNLQHRLPEAKSNYEIAYHLQSSPRLKEKLEKIGKEAVLEKTLSTYQEEHFLIKYYGDDEIYEGFELRELLRETYREISKEFGHYFRHKVTVLLYDNEDFQELVNQPHWVAGVYDGKIRMPINRSVFGEQEIRATARHEMTHAFVAAIADRKAPPWLNEGLAVYQESKVRPWDGLVFDSAVKTGTLFTIDQLMGQASALSFRDPLLVALFYQQCHQLTAYLVERYGMFKIKQMLERFAEGDNSYAAIRNVLRISPSRLEREWKDTLIAH